MTDHYTASPPTPQVTERGWVVVVLSCGTLGFEVAERAVALPGVDEAHVFTAPWQRRRPGLAERVRRSIRRDGPAATIRAILGRVVELPFGGTRSPGDGTNPLQNPRRSLPRGVGHTHVEDLDAPDTRRRLRELTADLGILAGTYVLPPRVFGIPRLGMINLHSGKVPEYRGSSPGFWELYNGETEIGITIHEVVEEVDAGRVLRAETFPLDPAPSRDPIDYLEGYRREVLRPNGIRMLVAAIDDLTRGTAHPESQAPGGPKPSPVPDYRAVRELRRRVRERRRSAG